MVGVHATVLVVLDTEKDEVKVLDGIPDNICPGQVIWPTGRRFMVSFLLYTVVVLTVLWCRVPCYYDVISG